MDQRQEHRQGHGAARGARQHHRDKASGDDAEGGVAALVDLVAADFPDNAP